MCAIEAVRSRRALMPRRTAAWGAWNYLRRGGEAGLRGIEPARAQRFGERISISEIDFQAERHPCENALRRLDSYQGALSPTGQELLLSWGNGSQLLRRR